MTIKLPSFPRELVGSDRLLSLSPRFFLSPRWRETIFFFIFPYRSSPTTVGPLDRLEKRGWKVCEAIPPLLSLSLSLLFEACLCLYSFGEKKEDVGRLLSSTHWIACGSRRNDLVCRDHRFHRDTGSGGGSGVDGNVFFVFFSFFFI